MTIYLLLWIAGLGAAGSEQVLDTFEYADSQAARRAWASRAETPPVTAVREDGRAVLKLDVPFHSRPNLSRVYIDRRVQLDLAMPGRFSLELAAEQPEAVERVTLYFRSGDGWYGSGAGLSKRGRQTLYFSKASFRPEGNPAGWYKIDTVRIAFWRGKPKDASVRIRRLAALSHDVALVVPGRNTGEAKFSRRTAVRIAAMLAELGLGADTIEQEALVRGSLGNRRVAVLPHNPDLSKDQIAALEQFVRAGGKLLACRNLPDGLAGLLGFRPVKHIRQQHKGQFAEIRFDAAGIPGIPQTVRQASWNITLAEPAGHNARVIGRWYDGNGKPTGHAAMLLSDRGAFLSHVILPDDRPGKRQLLAAILGHFAPPLWRQMAKTQLDQVGKVGHCDGLEQLVGYINAHGNAKTLGLLKSAEKTLAEANEQFAAKTYPQVIRSARKAHEQLVEAYLRAQPSPTREGRATWNHSGTGAYPGDWDRSARVLAEAGLNMILPNMLWAGRAHYASDVLPRSSTYREHGDQIAQCVAAAKKHGLKVHVWKVNYNLSGAPKDFVEKLHREGRTQVSVHGKPNNWLCPSHPENLKLELDSMLEIVRKYDVDGLHFDYIRYPGREYCYCDGCRKRFEADTGRKVADWPKDCHSGSRRDEYRDWRCRQITKLVAAVHREAKKIRPNTKISAAVFGSYPACRESVGQDWVAWVKAGYLDFLCPMDYTNSDLRFSTLVGDQLKLVGGRIPVYPGIGATSSNSTLSPDRVIGQIHHARRLGAAGFTIFNFSQHTAETIMPGVGLGAGSRKTTPPHTDGKTGD